MGFNSAFKGLMIVSGDFFFNFRISAFTGGTDFLIVILLVFKASLSSRLQARQSRSRIYDFISGRCNALFTSALSDLLCYACNPLQWVLELFARGKAVVA